MDYSSIRLALGLAQLAVAWLVWRRSVGYTFGFMFLMVAGGIFNVAPAIPTDEIWKHWVQVPSYGVLLAFTIAATIEAYAFLRRRTFPRERWLILAFSAVLGAAVVLAGWRWQPDNWYQAVMLARQYALLALCIGHCVAWFWVTIGRPVRMEDQTETHGTLWCVWLLCAALTASTTTGGLWRIAAPMTTGAEWRQIGCVLMVAQALICVMFALNLRRWRGILKSIRACHGGG